MGKRLMAWVLTFLAFVSFTSVSFADTAVVSVPQHAQATDAIQPSGLPMLGKWMIDEHGQVAHWLGEKYENLVIDEPVNIVIRVQAPSGQAAKELLLEAMAKVDYLPRPGHSSGYRALLGATFFPQIPATPGDAISDGDAHYANNHGRVFGPLLWQSSYYFTAAFSREQLNPNDQDSGPIWLRHHYDSFNQARDDFAQQMHDHGGAELGSPIPMGNAMPAGAPETTGDHDGNALFLSLQ